MLRTRTACLALRAPRTTTSRCKVARVRSVSVERQKATENPWDCLQRFKFVVGKG